MAHRRHFMNRIRNNRRNQTHFYLDVRADHNYQRYKRFRNKERQQCSNIAEYIVVASIHCVSNLNSIIKTTKE